MKWFCIIGAVVTIILGVISHFVYDWTGGNFFVGLFFPVNESTWEHMKLFFLPSFLFSLLQFFFSKNVIDSFWLVKFISLTIGSLLIPILFYTYNGAFGKSPDWVNILIFIISTAIAYFTEFLLLKRELPYKFSVWYFIALCAIALCFVVFTFFPPQLPLFQDPITKQYGAIF
jgi:hypothetical protein